MSVLHKINQGMLKIRLNEKIENMYKLYYNLEESSKSKFPDFYEKEELATVGIEDKNIAKFQRICDDIFVIVINLGIYHYEKTSENEKWVSSKNTYFLNEDLENIETYNDFQEKYNLIIKKIQDFKLIYEISVILGLKLKMLLEELEITLSDLLRLERKFLINETKDLQKKYQEVADKIEKTSEKNKRLTKEIEKTRKKNEKRQKEYDKRILELMGIFLSIFSVIGLGVTGILNIQDNLPTNILLIMGSILIVVTLLFALIKYDSENKYKFWILIIFGINLILTGIFFYNPVDKNWEEAKIKIENLEKKLDYEKRINELEKKTK